MSSLVKLDKIFTSKPLIKAISAITEEVHSKNIAFGFDLAYLKTPAFKANSEFLSLFKQSDLTYQSGIKFIDNSQARGMSYNKSTKLITASVYYSQIEPDNSLKAFETLGADCGKNLKEGVKKLYKHYTGWSENILSSYMNSVIKGIIVDTKAMTNIAANTRNQTPERKFKDTIAISDIIQEVNKVKKCDEFVSKFEHFEQSLNADMHSNSQEITLLCSMKTFNTLNQKLSEVSKSVYGNRFISVTERYNINRHGYEVCDKYLGEILGYKVVLIPNLPENEVLFCLPNTFQYSTVPLNDIVGKPMQVVQIVKDDSSKGNYGNIQMMFHGSNCISVGGTTFPTNLDSQKNSLRGKPTDDYDPGQYYDARSLRPVNFAKGGYYIPMNPSQFLPYRLLTLTTT